MSTPPPFDIISTHDFRQRGHELIDFIADYWERLCNDPPSGSPPGLPTLPVLSQARPGDTLARLPASPPASPEPWDDVMHDVNSFILPGLTHWQSPNFFAYFPANASAPGVLGDLLSAGLGVNGMLWATSPAATELETRMLDWMAEAVGLPESFRSSAPTGGGVIQGTASESTLVALLASRHRGRASTGRVSNSPSTPQSLSETTHSTDSRLRLYTSAQAHSSVVKAAMIAGLADGPDDRRRLRLIGTDDGHRMRPDLLAAAMQADADAGLIPSFVTATIGTTSSGAIDPIPEIAAITSRYNAWLHIDAAWAGVAAICPEHRGILAGVYLADSIGINPHKWLLTNFDSGLFFTRDRDAVTAALSITPEYLRNAASDAGAVIDYRDWQVPLGRRFRALKLWFVFRHFGVEGLRGHIRRHVHLAECFESLVCADPRFEVAAPRSLALLCFRLKPHPTDTSPACTDARNKRLLDAINSTGFAYLTHTSLPPTLSFAGGTVLRMAIGGTFTREQHLRAAWSLVQAAADRVS